MTLIEQIAATLQEARAHGGMAGLISANEREAGGQVLPVGAASPVHIDADDWHPSSVFALRGKEIRIVAVISLRRGSLTRLVRRVQAADLRPVVVEPVGLTMPAIMAQWGWRRTVVGRGAERCEEWRPAAGWHA